MMSNGAWSFAGPDGILTGGTFSGPARDLAANTPAGCIAVPGRHDHLCRRLDTATGHVVPYQPPAPPADEWRTWAWNTLSERWLPVATPAARARDVRAERDRRLAACDWTQAADAIDDMPVQQRIAWRQYRRALRDVPAQPGFPASVVWPIAPSSS